jgi:hypothetical protein
VRDGFDLIRDAYDVAGLDEHERAVLVRLAFMANEGKAWPSIAHLVEKLGKSERTVQRAIRRLVDAGHITQRQRRHDTAIYTVHPVLADPKPVSVTGVSATPVDLTPVTNAPKTRPTDTLIAKNNQSSPKTSSSSKNRAPEKTPFPSEFCPVMGLRTAAVVAGWPPGDLDDQLDRFAAYHRKEGTLSADWQASWTHWVSNSKKWDKTNEQSRSIGRPQANGWSPGDAILAAHDRVDFG